MRPRPLPETDIPYARVSWSPVTGCSHAHTGCQSCYAERLAATRLRHLPRYAGLTRDGRWTGEVRFNESELERPLATKRPSVVFMPLASDVFHIYVEEDWQDSIFHVIECTPQHTYLLFTKRPKYARAYWKSRYTSPPPNVICYYSASDQATLDAGIADHLATPWARHGLSLEPLVGPVDVTPWVYSGNGGDVIYGRGLSHVIVGGESGPRARPMHPQWARDVRDACKDADVPFYFKQQGHWAPLVDNGGPDWKRGDYYVGLNGSMRQADWLDETDQLMRPVGTRRSGHLLDGREWKEVAW